MYLPDNVIHGFGISKVFRVFHLFSQACKCSVHYRGYSSHNIAAKSKAEGISDLLSQLEFIIDKNTGVMTPKGDVDKALQAVDLFGRKKEEISRKCVEKAGAYNKDIKYNEYYELYKAL